MLTALTALALAANPYLDEGRRYFAALDFEAAARALTIAVDQPGLSGAERREAFDTLAQSLLATNHRDQAELAYRRLLEADPFAPTPVAAPKVVECFLRAKQVVLPRPSVTLKGSLLADRTVTVTVVDPWSMVKRVRWLESTADGVTEQPTPSVLEHAFTVAPSPQAQRLLFDALDPGDALLSHLEVELPRVDVVTPVASTPRWVTIALAVAAVVSAGLGATFLYLGYGRPDFAAAPDVNAWNAAAPRNAALGWSFGAVALGLGVAAGFVATH